MKRGRRDDQLSRASPQATSTDVGHVHRELIDLKVLQDGLERLDYPDVMKALQAHVSCQLR